MHELYIFRFFRSGWHFVENPNIASKNCTREYFYYFCHDKYFNYAKKYDIFENFFLKIMQVSALWRISQKNFSDVSWCTIVHPHTCTMNESIYLMLRGACEKNPKNPRIKSENLRIREMRLMSPVLSPPLEPQADFHHFHKFWWNSEQNARNARLLRKYHFWYFCHFHVPIRHERVLTSKNQCLHSTRN